MQGEVAILGFPSLISLMVSVDVKQHRTGRGEQSQCLAAWQTCQTFCCHYKFLREKMYEARVAGGCDFHSLSSIQSDMKS